MTDPMTAYRDVLARFFRRADTRQMEAMFGRPLPPHQEAALRHAYDLPPAGLAGVPEGVVAEARRAMGAARAAGRDGGA